MLILMGYFSMFKSPIDRNKFDFETWNNLNMFSNTFRGVFNVVNAATFALQGILWPILFAPEKFWFEDLNMCFKSVNSRKNRLEIQRFFFCESTDVERKLTYWITCWVVKDQWQMMLMNPFLLVHHLRISSAFYLFIVLFLGGMIGLGLANLIDKLEKDQLTPIDVLQFSMSVFLFSNTLIKPKTAAGIISKAQDQHFQVRTFFLNSAF